MANCGGSAAAVGGGEAGETRDMTTRVYDREFDPRRDACIMIEFVYTPDLSRLRCYNQ